MADWAVWRDGKPVAIYNGGSDEKNQAMAESAAPTYGPGCTVGPYTGPPPAVENRSSSAPADDKKR